MTQWTDIGMFISIIAASIAAIIAVTQKSRCSVIKVCCIKCEREVPPIEPDEPRTTSYSRPSDANV